MQRYETLRHEIFYPDQLSPEHKRFYRQAKEYYDSKPSWTEFGNFWMSRINPVLGNIARKDAVKHPIFRICQDMGSRLGIEQGYVRPTDYRDMLAEIIAREYHSRYQFCREVGVDEAFLSNVLNKKKHFSTKKLQEILERVGYQLEIMKKTTVEA